MSWSTTSLAHPMFGKDTLPLAASAWNALARVGLSWMLATHSMLAHVLRSSMRFFSGPSMARLMTPDSANHVSGLCLAMRSHHFSIQTEASVCPRHQSSA